MKTKTITAILLVVIILVSCSPMTKPAGKIAFSSNRDNNIDIYVMNVDGSNQIRLTNNQMNNVAPNWSADGQMIVFSAAVQISNEIFIMNPDGSNQTRLTNNQVDDVSASWSQ